MSEQFVMRKTNEEMKKEMEELTRLEMEKLTKTIKENPMLLQPKNIQPSESGTESEGSSSTSSSSSSSTSSYHSRSRHKSRKHKKQKNIIKKDQTVDIMKKDQCIDKLEEKNYYKTLELSNLILENGQMKQEIDQLKKVNQEYILQIKIISDIIELNKNEPLKTNGNYLIDSDLNNKNMSSKMFILQKEFDEYKHKITKLTDDLKLFNNDSKTSNIYIYYNKELNNITSKLNNNYDFNNKLIDTYISRTKNKEIAISIIIFLLVGFIMDVIMFNFSDKFYHLIVGIKK